MCTSLCNKVFFAICVCVLCNTLEQDPTHFPAPEDPRHPAPTCVSTFLGNHYYLERDEDDEDNHYHLERDEDDHYQRDEDDDDDHYYLERDEDDDGAGDGLGEGLVFGAVGHT